MGSGPADYVVVRLDGKEVLSSYKKSPNGSALLGIVTGMSNGENKIEVLGTSEPVLLRASLTLTNDQLQATV